MSMSNKRKKIDLLLQTITYSAAAIAVIILSMIVFFIFKNGSGLLNLDLITKDYHAQFYNGGIEDVTNFSNTEKPDFLSVEDYYSTKWGITLTDDEDRQGEPMIVVSYVADDSPLNDMFDKNNVNNQEFSLEEGHVLSSIKFYDKNSALSIYGAQYMIQELDDVITFREIVFSSLGGGIRGSLVTTLYVIGMTLIIALPIGIFTAIYLNEFAKKNRITNALRSMVEMLTGVPSIIFGLMGLAVFVPLTVNYTKADSANLISGSLTLAVILLPVIIRATEESLKVVPDDFRSASLALGANRTQTTFKVVLPSALPGILTATLLSVGRIIGESAALIFAIGTAIKDDISIFGKSTTLSVHIWSLMTDEPANIELASTIALIILIIVLILNLLVKLVSHKYLKKFA
ncbi:MAG: phosphate ABC transporter permease PstA [Tenericutes bacterium]|jgi:phosphate transport system permease protein|nr:phosphate ABC transporter permease PstA [Mycoplasmatota bacterium]